MRQIVESKMMRMRRRSAYSLVRLIREYCVTIGCGIPGKVSLVSRLVREQVYCMVTLPALAGLGTRTVVLEPSGAVMVAVPRKRKLS
jgi:hypothetical protein